MILTAHALAGAAIGKTIRNRWLIIIIALITHFMLDSLRHGEYSFSIDSATDWLKVIADMSFGFLIILFYLYKEKFNLEIIKKITLGVFFGMIPDLLTLIYWGTKWNFLKPIFDFHAGIHPYPAFSEETKWNLRNSVNTIFFCSIFIFILFSNSFLELFSYSKRRSRKVLQPSQSESPK